jgi:hypothetical protein
MRRMDWLIVPAQYASTITDSAKILSKHDCASRKIAKSGELVECSE